MDNTLCLMNEIQICIYTISTPNLGFEIAIPRQEREQGRFRGSIDRSGREYRYGGVRESTNGVYRILKYLLWSWLKLSSLFSTAYSVDFAIKGNPGRLRPSLPDARFRLCQSAIGV